MNEPPVKEPCTQPEGPPCKTCGVPMKVIKTWQRFCSIKCRNAFHVKARQIGQLILNGKDNGPAK